MLAVGSSEVPLLFVKHLFSPYEDYVIITKQMGHLQGHCDVVINIVRRVRAKTFCVFTNYESTDSMKTPNSGTILFYEYFFCNISIINYM